MKEKLFVYGTLREPDIQKDVIGRVIKGVPDILEGYKKTQIEIDQEIYPILAPCSKSKESIKGLVLLVTSEELERLDEYETDAYNRKKVVLHSGIEAWVYQN